MSSQKVPQKHPATILIIDDDILFAETVADKIHSLGYLSEYTHTLDNGIKVAERGLFDLILLDVNLPDGNGLAAIERLKTVNSRPQILIVTGFGDPDGAELAIQHGAWCYLEKRSIIKNIELQLTRSLQYRSAVHGSQARVQALCRENLVGKSHQFSKCLDKLAKAAHSKADVLVTGESGTGKEVFARAIHANSKRRQKNFVVVDCASLPEHLIESVLFGHVKGAFTGAEKASSGLISHADQGTLFLDEVGELPFAMQKKFLRVLQERSFRPVGSHKEMESDFRLVCATNRDLSAMTEEGSFREDLFHRLNGMDIVIPPLRKRKNDIPFLLEHFMERFQQQYQLEPKEYMTDYIEHLLSYDWPGNVRELSQTIESSFVQAGDSPVLFTQHLPMTMRTAYARLLVKKQKLSKGLGQESNRGEQILPWRQAKENFEQGYLTGLLEQTKGNIVEAGKLSGLSRTRIYQLLKKNSSDI